MQFACLYCTLIDVLHDLLYRLHASQNSFRVAHSKRLVREPQLRKVGLRCTAAGDLLEEGKLGWICFGED